MWTMEQLVERVGAALAAEYPGAPNGRVREVPDRRSIRWYTTIGLVDRPLGTRGRTVLYGPRHLLQLVAIKRRQAAGMTLAEIQAELAGASEETLAAVARVPDPVLRTDEPPPDGPRSRPDFWKASPAAPTRILPTGSAPDEAGDMPPATGITRREMAAAVEKLGTPAAPPPALITGVPIGDGVILLLPRHTTGLDRDEIAAAARPLLDLLAARGLTDGRTS
ncbi:MerR family transcriptional regulator [Actinoplanes sp. NPDC023801]|uniref:MerR family transcriptional regulator n=1 Tax=Actinoplanes sp. NPDC023801 TaxID=3154595 RepID=UPI003404585C